MKKINGFTQNKHPFQMISLILFFGDFFSYNIIIISLVDLPVKIVAAVLTIITALPTVYFGYYTISIDPTDEYVIQTINSRKTGNRFDPPIKELFCDSCRSFVKEKSKHCRRCNRCVENFDHHCKWVNNCIGSKNYKLKIVFALQNNLIGKCRVFIGLINSIFLFSVVYLIFSIILTIQYACEPTLKNNNIYMFDNESNKILIGMIIIWIFSLATIIFIIMDLQLVILHFWLIKNKISTYEYIMAQQLKMESENNIDQNKQFDELIQNDLLKKNQSKISTNCLDYILCLSKKRKSTRSTSPNDKINDIEGDKNEDKIKNPNDSNNLPIIKTESGEYSGSNNYPIIVELDIDSHNSQIMTFRKNMPTTQNNLIEFKEATPIEDNLDKIAYEKKKYGLENQNNI